MRNQNTNRVYFLTALAWAAGLFLVPILLGLAMQGANLLLNSMFDSFFKDIFYNQFLGPTIGGAVAGYLTVFILRRIPALRGLQALSILLIGGAAVFLSIILFFPIGGVFVPPSHPEPPVSGSDQYMMNMPPLIPYLIMGFLVWILPGALIGLALAREVDRHGLKIGGRKVAWIAAGWALGFALGGGVGTAAGNLVALNAMNSNSPAQWVLDTLPWISYGITGLIGGLAGGWATMRAIRTEIGSLEVIFNETGNVVPEKRVRGIQKKRLLSLAILLLIPILCGALWFFYLRSAVIRVTLFDGQIQVNPAVLKGVRGAVRIYGENKGTQPHQFIIIVTEKPSNQLPVINGEAQFFTEPGVWTSIVYDGYHDSGFAMPGPAGNPPLGPPLQPGEKREVNYGYPGMGPGAETLTILCNLPGHYERGEFATVTINK